MERDRDSKKGSGAPYSPDFEKFWSTYPNRKGGKGEAWRIWSKKLKAGTLPPILDLIAAVEALKRSQGWLKDDGRYIPMVTTFLNQGRWTDADGLGNASVAGANNNAGPSLSKPTPNCPDCNGSGWIPYVQDGLRYSRKCPCRKGDFDDKKAAQGTS